MGEVDKCYPFSMGGHDHGSELEKEVKGNVAGEVRPFKKGTFKRERFEVGVKRKGRARGQGGGKTSSRKTRGFCTLGCPVPGGGRARVRRVEGRWGWTSFWRGHQGLLRGTSGEKIARKRRRLTQKLTDHHIPEAILRKSPEIYRSN